MTHSEPKSKAGHEAELRSFARTRSRGLTARQQDIVERVSEKVSIRPSGNETIAPLSLFGENCREVWLEIGFGGGEHLIWQARENPTTGLIGCEPFRDGVVRVLTAIDSDQLENIRLYADDARPLLRCFEPASIDRVFILFPDPWPKKRHNKRRLINSGLVSLLARIMKPGAELRIATDIDDYLRSILLAFHDRPEFHWVATSPTDWRRRTADWPSTRYEAKAIREQRSCTYLRFQRTS